MVSLRIVAAVAFAAPSMQQTCNSIENNVDYPGNDLQGVAAAAAEDCCAICASTPQCAAFSYAYGTCYLKSSKGTPKQVAGVRSSTLVTSSSNCPTIENDTDYFGGDFKEVPASKAEDCCDICKNTPGCKVFSHAYGTCYLKNAQGAKSSKAGVRSAVMNQTPSSCPTIENDTDYFGGDFKEVPASKAEDCCDICKNTPGCKVFSHAYGTCYLKNAQGAKSSKSGVRSAVIQSSQAGQCQPTVNGVDYAGYDIADFPGSSASECCDKCQATQGCNVYVWYNNVCYLKSAKGASSFLNGAVASSLTTYAPTCAKIEENVDYAGGDLTSVKKATAEECCDACRSTPGCNLFTWSWDTCYLKSSQGTKKASSGARSMVLSTAPQPPKTPAPTPSPTTSKPTPAPTPSPTTVAPTPTCGHRQRKAWSTLSQDEKNLYISAVEESMKKGLYQRFLSVHNDLKDNIQAHGTCVFLFWHRKYILAFENMLRSLGPKYQCLTLSYWDYTTDYATFQSKKCKTIAECSVATRDLGGSTQGINPEPADEGHTNLCVTARPLNSYNDGCVVRGDWHKTDMPDWSIASARSSLFDNGISIAKVSNDLELGIHGSVHMELRGIMANGFLSPRDPIFYLHHTMIDLLHTVFYHCKVEGLNLDPQGQQTHESSFAGCTVNYNDGVEQVGPTSKILMRSHVDLDDDKPIPVEQDPLIGKFFKDLPSEYYKLTDARTLGYSYNFVGLVGNLYNKCDATRTESVSSGQFAEEHTITAPFKETNIKSINFEDAIVQKGTEQGLTTDASYVELKKINLMLHVNCFGGVIVDYPQEFKDRLHLKGQKPQFALWQQLQSKATKIEIVGWQEVAQQFYNCTGDMK